MGCGMQHGKRKGKQTPPFRRSGRLAHPAETTTHAYVTRHRAERTQLEVHTRVPHQCGCGVALLFAAVTLQSTGSLCRPYSVKCKAAAANTEFCDGTSGGDQLADAAAADFASASGVSPSRRPQSTARKMEYNHGSGRSLRRPVCSRQDAGCPIRSPFIH